MERAFGSLWIDWKNGFELWNTSIKFMRKRIFLENKAVIFDLELTSWPGINERNWSRPNEHREIIQIGAVIYRNNRKHARGKWLSDIGLCVEKPHP
mgnify:FL=1